MVSTVHSGVVLDVQVVPVESVTEIYALETTTGQRFGPDGEARETWWKAESIREEAERIRKEGEASLTQREG